ncbi:MBL fold metallo-hydrolase [Pedobacter frigoris]|uniref:MBL fold metallo-hydrolase n=2 Tax=Pedobacter frigoris TaxID=2571272 RepID=A0A4U1CTQ7_9SPHI|nr:MBL fold metallo-hydrolase [Pedobacter frigoris]
MKKRMIYTLVVFIILVLITVWVVNLPIFGKVPEGARLERISNLSNYKDGALENLSPTPMKPDSVSYWDMIRGMIKGNKNGTPPQAIPTVKPDFSPSGKAKIIWFGHSTYLIQVDGLNILVDPVFSERPSPLSFIGSKNYKGTDFVKPEDFPALDVVLITHDHYDHLDYNSILKLKDKTKRFVTSLGVGSHLEYWGVQAEKITELVWNEDTTVGPLKFTALPARHFTGRLFKRNQTLWSAFVLQTSGNRLYLGGDSGYDTHFKKAGEEFGPFDIAILECGQYNAYWPLIHMFPEQTVQAAIDLEAKVLMPVHWGKFTLAMHDWNEPAIRVVRKAKAEQLKITTPLMGESVILDETYPSKEWWTF